LVKDNRIYSIGVTELYKKLGRRLKELFDKINKFNENKTPIFEDIRNDKTTRKLALLRKE
jgi:hypothetical protein